MDDDNYLPDYDENEEIFLNKFNENKYENRKNSDSEEEIDLENNFKENETLTSFIFRDSTYKKDSMSMRKKEEEKMKIDPAKSEKYEIYFVVQKQKIKQNKKRVLSFCPYIEKCFKESVIEHINTDQNKYELVRKLPSEVSFPCLCDFFDIAEGKYSSSKIDVKKAIQILVISIYFKNKYISEKVLNELIIEKINENNSLYLFETSLEYLTDENKQKKLKKDSYYLTVWNKIIKKLKELFVKHIEVLFILNQETKEDYNTNESLKKLKRKIIKEIIEVYLQIKYHDDSNYVMPKELCELICYIYNTPYNNLFNLLFDLYAKKSSADEVKKFQEQAIPINLDLMKIVNNDKSNDFELVMNNQVIKIKCEIYKNLSKEKQIIFSVNVNKTPIFLLSIINFPNCDYHNQISHFCINYSATISEKNSRINFYICIDYIFSALFKYTTNNLSTFLGILKYSPITEKGNNFMKILISHLSTGRNSHSSILACVLGYFSVYKSKGDNDYKCFNRLLQMINFKEVDVEILCEFYINFSGNFKIEKTNFENVLRLLKDKKLDKIVQHCAKQVSDIISLKDIQIDENGTSQKIAKLKVEKMEPISYLVAPPPPKIEKKRSSATKNNFSGISSISRRNSGTSRFNTSEISYSSDTSSILPKEFGVYKKKEKNEKNSNSKRRSAKVSKIGLLSVSPSKPKSKRKSTEIDKNRLINKNNEMNKIGVINNKGVVKKFKKMNSGIMNKSGMNQSGLMNKSGLNKSGLDKSRTSKGTLNNKSGFFKK